MIPDCTFFLQHKMNRLEQVHLEEEKMVNGKVFPLTLSMKSGNTVDQVSDWIRSHKAEFDNMLREHSAILLRGIKDARDHSAFHTIVEATGYQAMPYIGGAAVRTKLTERVFTANESPSSENIPFHHELAQTPEPPTHLFFFCETPPQSGGETPIVLSAEVYDRMAALHPQFMQRIEQVGVKYVRIMPEDDDPSSAIGRGWKSTFGAKDKG